MIRRELQGKADPQVVKAIRELYDYAATLRGNVTELRQEMAKPTPAPAPAPPTLEEQGLNLALTAPVQIGSGDGTPEGVQLGNPGDLYIRKADASAGATLYIKETGVATRTGWNTSITSGGGSLVSSVFGRTGAVVAAANDYSVAQLSDVAWSSWTPTWTNLSVGNGTVVAKYKQIGKSVLARLSLVSGTTTSVSGAIKFSLPVTSVSYAGSANCTPLGPAGLVDAGTRVFQGLVMWLTTTTAGFVAQELPATYLSSTNTSATVPFTWGSADEIDCQFFYEAA